LCSPGGGFDRADYTSGSSIESTIPRKRTVADGQSRATEEDLAGRSGLDDVRSRREDRERDAAPPSERRRVPARDPEEDAFHRARDDRAPKLRRIVPLPPLADSRIEVEGDFVELPSPRGLAGAPEIRRGPTEKSERPSPLERAGKEQRNGNRREHRGREESAPR
jgi:hypothetical protein